MKASTTEADDATNQYDKTIAIIAASKSSSSSNAKNAKTAAKSSSLDGSYDDGEVAFNPKKKSSSASTKVRASSRQAAVFDDGEVVCRQKSSSTVGSKRKSLDSTGGSSDSSDEENTVSIADLNINNAQTIKVGKTTKTAVRAQVETIDAAPVPATRKRRVSFIGKEPETVSSSSDRSKRSNTSSAQPNTASGVGSGIFGDLSRITTVNSHDYMRGSSRCIL